MLCIFLKFDVIYLCGCCSHLRGVITKKDILRHIKQLDLQDPASLLFS